MRSLRSVWIELAREKHAGGLQDLVGSAQLRNLPAEGLYLLPLVAAQNVLAPTLIRFYLAHVFAQRLGCDAQVSPNMRDRAPRLEHQPRRALEQLLGILPHSWHDRRLLLPPGKPWLRSLRQTQDGSERARARHWGAHLIGPRRAKPRGRPQAPDVCASLRQSLAPAAND